MAIKTSQLQIRVTEEEKAALRRLARAANLSVSRYVLAQALPSREAELTRLLGALTHPGEAGAAALDELHRIVNAAPPDELAEVLGHPPLERLNPVLQNQLAAILEQAAAVKGVDPPVWVADVAPMPRPHFGWSLPSLHPHQIRVTPVPFKRRGLFFEPATRPGLARGLAAPPPDPAGAAYQRLATLGASLSLSELKVEFYLVGGAVLLQVFHAHPPTAHVSALFRPPTEVIDAMAGLEAREGWDSSWLRDAVKELLVGGLRPDRYFEMPNIAVFVPQPEYVLAVKVAALRLETGTRMLDDLRYVLRSLDVGTPEAALEVAERYFGKRQLPPEAHDVLAGLLAP